MTQLCQMQALSAGSRCTTRVRTALRNRPRPAALRHATEGIALCRQFVYTTPLAG